MTKKSDAAIKKQAIQTANLMKLEQRLTNMEGMLAGVLMNQFVVLHALATTSLDVGVQKVAGQLAGELAERGFIPQQLLTDIETQIVQP